MLNERGQAFSVFKLLIAAIVAVFILTILLQILMQIVPPSQGDPTDEASSKIKTLINNLGTPERTGLVTFKNGTSLRSRTIAEKTGSLGEHQLCVLISDTVSGSNPNFEEVTQGSWIRYNGNSDQQQKLYVLCDDANRVEETVLEARLDTVFPGYDSLCGGGTAIFDPSNTERICLVSIIPAS